MDEGNRSVKRGALFLPVFSLFHLSDTNYIDAVLLKVLLPMYFCSDLQRRHAILDPSHWR